MPAEQLRDAAYAVQGQDLSWRPHVDGWLLPAHADAQAEAGGDPRHRLSHRLHRQGHRRRPAPAGGRGPLVPEPVKAGEKARVLLLLHPETCRGTTPAPFTPASCGYQFQTMDRCWRPWEPCDRELSPVPVRLLGEFCQNRRPQRGGPAPVEALHRRVPAPYGAGQNRGHAGVTPIQSIHSNRKTGPTGVPFSFIWYLAKKLSSGRSRSAGWRGPRPWCRQRWRRSPGRCAGRP